RDGARLVGVGAGWIGLENATAARRRGGEAVVVEPALVPLRPGVGAGVGRAVGDRHGRHRTESRFRSKQAVDPTGVGGRLIVFVLAGGGRVPADVVLFGVGARPATELAESAGLAVGDGVLVDAGMRTSDPDVYAAGDVASRDHPVLGTRIRVEHW